MRFADSSPWPDPSTIDKWIYAKPIATDGDAVVEQPASAEIGAVHGAEAAR